MLTAHNGLKQEVKKYLLRIARGSTMAEMFLKNIAFFFFFFKVFNAASFQINRRGKEDK